MLFTSVSVGVVFGLRLADGRRVVVKAHQPRQPRELLEEVRRVQAFHAREGFPCPRPLAGPVPLGAGFGMAEELVDAGEPRDPHEPGVRRAMAELLARHLDLARACGGAPALARGWSLFGGEEERLWPRELHSPIFDFEATAAGAEWIDAVAARAKPLAAGGGEPLPGHHDWSAEHFRFSGDEVSVVYDWDSVALGPEERVVGIGAATFTANPALGFAAPAPDEAHAFVDEYAAARGRPLSRAQRERIAAVATYVIAYIARCEHTGVGAREPGVPGGFMAVLREHGLEYLSA